MWNPFEKKPKLDAGKKVGEKEERLAAAAKANAELLPEATRLFDELYPKGYLKLSSDVLPKTVEGYVRDLAVQVDAFQISNRAGTGLGRNHPIESAFDFAKKKAADDNSTEDIPKLEELFISLRKIVTNKLLTDLHY